MEHQTKTARGNDTDLPISERKPPARETFVPEPLLDSWQAAAMMNVHPKTLQKLARQGQIPRSACRQTVALSSIGHRGLDFRANGQLKLLDLCRRRLYPCDKPFVPPGME